MKQSRIICMVLALLFVLVGCEKKEMFQPNLAEETAPGNFNGKTFSPGTQTFTVGNNAPMFDPSSPCGENQIVAVTCTLKFDIMASDIDAHDMVTLTALNLPSGATMTPALPATGNPVKSTFSWRPDNVVPPQVITFQATDKKGNVSECQVTVIPVPKNGKGKIGDEVFCDLNNNGVFDNGEPGIPGVKVDYVHAGIDGEYGTADDITGTQFTDAGGNYLFENVHVGQVIVSIDLSSIPADKEVGKCPTSVSVPLQPGDWFTEADFCLKNKGVTGEIGDQVYCDLNDNGQEDPGEPGVENVKIKLTCVGPDGVFGTADDIKRTTKTDPSGFYLFSDVPAGKCKVRIKKQSIPNDKELGKCPVQFKVTLQAGESFLDADFCVVNKPVAGQIGDFVYCDLNDNGVFDNGEPGIPNVVIDLTCAGPDGVFGTADDFVDQTATDNNGEYLFTNVPEGLCEVTVDVTSAPPGKEVGQCPTTVNVDLGPGQSFLDADFCFRNTPPGGEIGDFVYCDLNNNGVFDQGEPGIPGVAVNLTCAGADNIFGTADDINDQRITDASGFYLFESVPSGQCRVEVDLTTTPAGKKTGLCPTTVNVNLQPNQSFLDADFCFIFIPTDCCVGKSKIKSLTMLYTGQDSNASHNSQDPKKTSAVGDPNFASPVRIIAKGKKNGNLFDGVVNLGETFVIDAANIGKNKLDSETNVEIFDLNGNLLQTIKFHTSCSQPLFIGDQFGSLVLTGCENEGGTPPGGGTLCDSGKPKTLTMVYTGEDCSASNNGQGSKATCSGDPNFASPVRIIASGDKKFKKEIYFDGTVNLSDSFVLDATNGKKGKFKSNTYVEVRDLNGNVLQSLTFHTSCSKPLNVGDQFGSLLLIDFTLRNK